jgi:hypothetical protein
MYGLAVDWEYGKYNHPSVVITHFGRNEKNELNINKIVPTLYKNHECQKNWVPFTDSGKLFTIYSHHPLTILELNPETGEETVIFEKFSRYNLSNIRGSSVPIRLQDNTWIMLVHEVVNIDTRKYYHRFLKYSSGWDLISVSMPFYFNNLFVEFTLSLFIKGKNIHIPFSTEDNTTEIVVVQIDSIDWIPDDMRVWLKNNV